MAVTKTNFINYSRCPRYIALDKIKNEKLDADISYQDYLNEEKELKIQEMLSKMYEVDEEGEEQDLVDVKDRQLEAMMDYYKDIELIAGKIAQEKFGGKTIYAENTKSQECFDFTLNGIRYLCYVDIYNENEKNINIIEVKATTSNKFLKLGTKVKESFYPIFESIDGILYLKNEISYDLEQEMNLDKFQKQKNKLFDRYQEGKYVYDLAVQRFIIEGELRQSNNEEKLTKFNYYLAVLNHEYIFDGTYEDSKPKYQKDEYGHEIITFIDLTKTTEEYQELIKDDAKRIEERLFNPDAKECPLGKYCEYKKQTTCKFFNSVCGTKIPSKNSSLNYMDNGHGFVDDSGDRIKGLELINEGYLDMLDIPENWITKDNHFIQRNALKNDTPYINIDKIKLALNELEYPIYHLDFETFPCPLPRYKGERPYTQSPFEFSLHIEHAPGECDKDKDNCVFLATSHQDEREDLVKKMLEYINPNQGTLFAQNVSFEKSRIKELAVIFPKYSQELMKIYNRGFDLIWLLKTKTDLYQDLGYEEKEAKKVNYYHKDLSGSYSIKKTLPVFSNLSYQDLTVKNGTDAIIEYANYPKMTKEEFRIKYEALVEYCKQDTWAMVVILQGLRNLVKDVSNIA